MPTEPHARPGERLLQLNIPVVLPGVDDAGDGCVTRLQQQIASQTGVSEAHITSENGQSLLCLHYDPNLVPLEKLERLTRDYGVAITTRFRHEVIPVKGMDCASCAASIEHVVRKVPGVLRVSVNYAVEKMKVEYDSTLTDRERLAKAVRSLGYRVGEPLPSGRVRAASQLLPMVGQGSVLVRPQETPVTTHEPGEHQHVDDEDHAHDEHDHDSHEHHDHDHHGHFPSEHEEHDHTEDDHDDHTGHSHGDVDPNANWLARNPELALALLSGLLTGIGFIGQIAFGLPMPVGIGIYALAYVAGGYDLARHTIPTVLHGRFDVELLMLVAAIGAALLGEWLEGALLLFLFSLGHALEHFAMGRARQAIRALGQVVPKTARVRRQIVGGAWQESEIPVEELQVGDLAIVRPGERIAVDGQIASGHSTVDQSPITGESVPVEKNPDDNVFAGSINGDGALEVKVAKLAGDTTMARVIEMVEEAQSQKSPTQTFTTRFERIFVPCVLIGVVLSAVVPPLAGWLTWKVAILRALSALVAASPCALALATPAAVLAGIGQAARNGILIKGGVHLENLGSLRAIALDKTGTITNGRPAVTDIVPASGVQESELLRIAGAVESKSAHPLAEAVTRYVEAQKIVLPASGELQTLQGRGVQAQVEDQTVRIGNLRMMEEAQIVVPSDIAMKVQEFASGGKSSMVVSRGTQVLGALALADGIRLEAREALERLQKLGIRHLVMLTGDNTRVAEKIAATAGLTDFRADLLPADKVTALKALLSQYGQVAMIGDGVNDAPALATATVGIAMGAGGTDVALETADVALMADDLSKLPFAVGLSRQSRAIIRQNLCIALGVIALLLPATLFGFANMGLAVIFHEGSTLVVVFNALRLLAYSDHSASNHRTA